MGSPRRCYSAGCNFVSYLVEGGWMIESETDTASRSRGIDIVAVNKQRRLAVEVKGFPATTYARGPKAGRPKPTPPTLQARHWLAEALLTTLLTRARHADHEIAFASRRPALSRAARRGRAGTR